jgi:hypothetical protein
LAKHAFKGFRGTEGKGCDWQTPESEELDEITSLELEFSADEAEPPPEPDDGKKPP